MINIFKKREKKEKENKEKKVVKKDKEEEKKETIQKKSALKRKSIPEDVAKLCFIPHISEKATFLTKKNQYVFKVPKKANKKQIKKAIELMYNVNVLSVKTINIPSKKRRYRLKEGKKPGYKKAIVKLKEGQSIEMATP